MPRDLDTAKDAMTEYDQSRPIETALLAATRTSMVASRMAIRLAFAGIRVAAIYPSRTHPLANTRAVGTHFHYSMVDPLQSMLAALRESGAGVVIPCDGLTIRHLHALYAMLPASEDGVKTAEILRTSLGDPAAYLLVDSRHEVQTAARAEGLEAAESFALGRATDPQAIAHALPFPWVLKADYIAGGAGTHVVASLSAARKIIRRAGAPPNLATVMGQLVVEGDRAAMGEWLRAMRPGLSAQRPVPGVPASTVAACWAGEVLALISVQAVFGAAGTADPPAKVEIIDNGQMVRTARIMTEKLGLSGFQDFEFMLDLDSGRATLIEINPYCVPPMYLNAGPGHDPVDAFCRRWLGRAPVAQPPAHPGRLIAYFPESWAANPSDPVLETGAYDLPAQDPELVNHVIRKVRRNRRYSAIQSGLRTLLRRDEGE
jgi:hypothetical protein